MEFEKFDKQVIINAIQEETNNNNLNDIEERLRKMKEDLKEIEDALEKKKEELKEIENRKKQEELINYNDDDFVWIEEYASLRELYDNLKPEKILLKIYKNKNPKIINMKMYYLTEENGKKIYKYTNTITPHLYTYKINEKKMNELTKKGIYDMNKFGIKKFEQDARGLHSLYYYFSKNTNLMNETYNIETKEQSIKYIGGNKKIYLSNIKLKPFIYKIVGDNNIYNLKTTKDIIEFLNDFYGIKYNYNMDNLEEKINNIINTWIRLDGELKHIAPYKTKINNEVKIFFYLDYEIKICDLK